MVALTASWTAVVGSKGIGSTFFTSVDLGQCNIVVGHRVAMDEGFGRHGGSPS